MQELESGPHAAGVGGQPGAKHARHMADGQYSRRHRRRQRHGRKPTWTLAAGSVSFLVVLWLRQQHPTHPDLAPDNLTGALLWIPLAFAVLCGMAASAVLVAFRSRNPDGKPDTELRHVVGRKLVKLCLAGLFYGAGWIGALFTTAVVLMLRA